VDENRPKRKRAGSQYGRKSFDMVHKKMIYVIDI